MRRLQRAAISRLSKARLTPEDLLTHEDSNAALRQSDHNWKSCGQLRVVSSDHVMVPLCRLVSDGAEISDADAIVSASPCPSLHNNVNSIEVALTNEWRHQRRKLRDPNRRLNPYAPTSTASLQSSVRQDTWSFACTAGLLPEQVWDAPDQRLKKLA